MEISALFQDLIKQIVSEISLNSTREINLGDLLTARVKTVDGENVLLRAYGMDIPAKTLIPLEVGETLTFQYQGIQNGKAFFRLVDNNLPQKESEFVARVLQSFDLPDTDINREIVNQMIRQQMPMDKKDVIQLGNQLKNQQIPTEDIEPALFLFRQSIPPTPENINLLKEFQSYGLNLFQGLNEMEKLVTDNKTLAPALKDELTQFLNKLSSFQITAEDSGSEILSKLSQAPSFLLNQPEGQGLTIAPSKNTVTPSLVDNTEIIITSNQDGLGQAISKQADSKQAIPGQTVSEQVGQKEASNSTTIAKTSQEADPPPALPLNREEMLGRLEVLAGKSIGDHEKLSLFLKNTRAALKPQSEELREIINKISAQLDSAKPEEHAIRDTLKNISSRLDFVDQLVQRAPTENNQQIVFYSQLLLKDNSNHQRPVTITIKRSKDQRDKKINFDNCNLAISLQTYNLSLVKAKVKKSVQNLNCQLIVDNENAKSILDPVLPELVEALEKLSFNVTLKPVLLQTSSKKGPLPVPLDVSNSLFNIDIRI